MIATRRGRAVVVPSALTPGTAVDQLRVGRVGDRWYPHFTSAQGLRPVIVGRIAADDLRLHVRRGRRNHWRPVLRGGFEAVPGGSRFVGAFGWAGAVRIGTAVWFGLVGLLLVAGVPRGEWVAAGMAAAGAALCAVGTRSGRDDERVMRDWLTERIGGSAG